MRWFLQFKGVKTNPDNMIAEEDLLGLFDGAISAYDRLLEEYSGEFLEQAA